MELQVVDLIDINKSGPPGYTTAVLGFSVCHSWDDDPQYRAIKGAAANTELKKLQDGGTKHSGSSIGKRGLSNLKLARCAAPV